jgi:hypothetical protein
VAALDGSALDTLHWLGRNLHDYNGKRLMPRTGAIAMVMVGDASRTSVGGFCTHRALLEGIAGVPFDDAGWQAMIAAWTDRQLEVGLVTVVDLTPEQQEAAKTEALSSTWRELKAMLTMLEVAEANCPEVVRHARVQYLTDSMSAKHAASGQKGNRAQQQLVRDIWLLCHRLDLQLEVEWRPRREELQQLADALSKVQDGSQWALNQQVYTSVVLALLHRCCPGVADFTVDLFADPSNAKVAAFFQPLLRARDLGGAWGQRVRPPVGVETPRGRATAAPHVLLQPALRQNDGGGREDYPRARRRPAGVPSLAAPVPLPAAEDADGGMGGAARPERPASTRDCAAAQPSRPVCGRPASAPPPAGPAALAMRQVPCLRGGDRVARTGPPPHPGGVTPGLGLGAWRSAG